MSICENCGKQNLNNLTHCERCGIKLKTEAKKGLIFVIAFIVLVLLIIGIKFIPNKDGGNSPDTPSSPISIRSDLLHKILSVSKIRVAMESDAAPMNYLYLDGSRKGFDFELAQAISRNLGIRNVEVVEAEYSKIPHLIDNDKADIIMGGYVADPSLTNIDWTDGYLDFGLCLITHKSSAIKRIQDLKGYKLLIYKDPAAASWVKDNILDAIVTQSEETGWMKACDDGTVDAIIYDYPFAIKEIQEFPNLRIRELNLNNSTYQIGIPKGNRDLLDKINLALVKIKDSKFYEDLVKKYLKSDKILTEKISSQTKTYIVRASDTLASIAKSQLGDSKLWSKIWELNKSRLANPNLIFTGDTIVLP